MFSVGTTEYSPFNCSCSLSDSCYFCFLFYDVTSICNYVASLIGLFGADEVERISNKEVRPNGVIFPDFSRWRRGRTLKALVSGTNVVVGSRNDYLPNVSPRVSPLYQLVNKTCFYCHYVLL